MESNIILRSLEKQDLKALEDIIRITWNYDKFASSKTAKKLARVYLASCLTNQTYSRVAVVDGKIAGLILGKNVEKHHCPLKYRLHEILSILQLLITKEGRQLCSFYGGISDIDEKLLKQCPKKYKGEIALFALSPQYRGLGIGQKLFDCVTAYMKSENIEDFYLYTDTSCNYGFYEHQGMKRQQAQKQTLQINGQTSNMEFYLYDMNIACLN